MTRIKIRVLVWNEWNIGHIKKHKVTQKEIEIAVLNMVYHSKTDKNRYKAVGRSKTRILTTILNRNGIATYFVVTARDSDKKERQKLYDKERL